MDENQKLINLMRFWLFGTFVIVFTAITMYIGLFTNQNPWVALRHGFPIWGITALLCAVWYYGYKWYLARSHAA